MWGALLLLSLILPPALVAIEGRKAKRAGLERQEALIRIERAVLISIVITLVLLTIAGILGFFDFVSRFREPIDKLVLALPVLVSITASVVTAEAVLEEIELSSAIKALLLTLGALITITAMFAVVPSLFPPEAEVFVYILLALITAEVFSQIIRRIGKGQPLDGELREEIESLCRKAGVAVEKIYVIEDEDINAIVTGAKGKTIFVTRGALENLERDELLAIIAHELGHIRRKHLFKGHALTILPIIPTLILLKIGEKLPEDVLTLSIAVCFAVLIAGVFYRFAKFNLTCELEADEFAGELVGADAMIRALKKISEHDEIPTRTPKWFDVIYSHPSIEIRIKNLQANQARSENRGENNNHA